MLKPYLICIFTENINFYTHLASLQNVMDGVEVTDDPNKADIIMSDNRQKLEEYLHLGCSLGWITDATVAHSVPAHMHLIDLKNGPTAHDVVSRLRRIRILAAG